MKKILFTILACMTLGLSSAFAQREAAQAPEGRHMRGGMTGAMRSGMELAADTAITNHLNLADTQRASIDSLNADHSAKVQALLANRDGQSHRVSREERDKRMQQMTSLRQEARQGLRQILGDELYIQYLEQLIDRRPSMMMGGPGRNTNAGGGRMGAGHMDRGRMDRGGMMGGRMDGDDF